MFFSDNQKSIKMRFAAAAVFAGVAVGSTVYSTDHVTITSCAPEVTDCPGNNNPGYPVAPPPGEEVPPPPEATTSIPPPETPEEPGYPVQPPPENPTTLVIL